MQLLAFAGCSRTELGGLTAASRVVGGRCHNRTMEMEGDGTVGQALPKETYTAIGKRVAKRSIKLESLGDTTEDCVLGCAKSRRTGSG